LLGPWGCSHRIRRQKRPAKKESSAETNESKSHHIWGVRLQGGERFPRKAQTRRNSNPKIKLQGEQAMETNEFEEEGGLSQPKEKQSAQI